MRWWGCRQGRQYKHITDCIRTMATPQSACADSSPYTGAPRVQSLLMPVYFDCYANRSSNPSVTFGDSSPYTGKSRVVASTLAVLFFR